MSVFSLGIIIEGLVASLLVLTIFYCVILNKRLKRLRADEESLRGTIAELVTATEIAERAIMGLKSTAADCDVTLSQRLTQAETFSHEIAQKIEAGDAIVHHISQIAGVVRVETQSEKGSAARDASSDMRELSPRLRGLKQAVQAAGFDLPKRGVS